MKIVAVSQRVDVFPERNERRDAIDQRLIRWLMEADCVPLLVPNTLSTLLAGKHDKKWSGLQNWLFTLNPDAVLLSGGNDIGEAPERDDTEHRLLAYANELVLPTFGICRGMQMMAVWAGGSIEPMSGHRRTRHCLQAAENLGEWPNEVNSFHNFTLADCPPGFVVVARAEDGTIEAMRHEILPWEGWMWHPEREPKFNPIDIMRFRALLDSKSTR